MSQRKSTLGSDPLANRPDPLAYISQGVEIKQTASDSKRKGYNDFWERHTYVARTDLLDKLKDYAYTNRLSMKDAYELMMEQFLADKHDLVKRKREQRL